MHPSRRHVLRTFAVALASAPVFARGTSTMLGLRFTRSADDLETFLAAVRVDDLATVDSMLVAEPSLAVAVDESGRSAYVLSRLAGADQVAARVLKEGIELDLIEAVLASDWKRVAALAANEPAALEAVHPIGGGALYAAARCGVGKLYELRSLGCDPDARPAGGSGWTPVRAGVECADPIGALDTVQELLGNGSDPNAAQEAGSSLLHGAVGRRDATMVRLVVRKGGDVGAQNAAGETPLQLARRLGWREGAELLASHAELPRDHRSSRFRYDANRTPIVFADLSDVARKAQSAVTAKSHGNLNGVRALLSKDRRLVFSISTDDELAIEACAHTANRPIIALHLDHGSPYSLPTAVVNGDLEFARFLLDDDPKRVYERGAHDFALMWYTALGGDELELAELLLERGAPVDQESLGTTTLHRCAQRNRRDLAGFLIDAGADVDAIGYRFDRSGQTPLQVALQKGSEDVAKILRDAGARH